MIEYLLSFQLKDKIFGGDRTVSYDTKTGILTVSFSREESDTYFFESETAYFILTQVKPYQGWVKVT